MPDFSLYRRNDLIKIIRANPSYLQPNIMKHTKEELVDICNITTAEDVMKNKKDNQPIEEQQRITLNELTDESETESESESESEEEKINEPLQVMNKPSRLNRKKLNLPEEPKKQSILKNNNAEGLVKQLLKNYTVDVRDLLLNFDDDAELDIYDERTIITEYNKIREDVENQIDSIAQELQNDFSDKFYQQISKILDQSLNKVQSFLNLK